jgi:hypothetical protein
MHGAPVLDEHHDGDGGNQAPTLKSPSSQPLNVGGMCTTCH